MKKETLALLLAGSPYIQILFEVDDDGGLVGVVATKAAHRSGLLRVDDVAGRRAEEIVPQTTIASLRSGFHDALQLNEAVTYEEFATLGDREVWGMTTLTPLIDEQGVPAHVLMSFLVLDFVERTEAALAATEAGLRHLVDVSSDAILITLGERVVHANAAATERYAISAGQPLAALLPDGVASTRATINGADVGVAAIALSEQESCFLLVVKPS